MLISIPHSSSQEIAGTTGSSLEKLGQSNSLILANAAKRHHWIGAGPLSLKLYLSGQATFTVSNRSYTIDEQSYLIVNDGEPYEVIIDEDREVKAFCIFFQRNLLSEQKRSAEYSDSELLDTPFLEELTDSEFCQHTFRRDEKLDSIIHSLHTAVKAEADVLTLDAKIRELLTRILIDNYSIHNKERRLQFAKKSTREELIKRLLTARDYMHATYRQQITLDDIAKEACLSVSHFIRTFKQAFHQTPNRYIMRLRMDKARKLLEYHPDLSITSICFECGFESVGYFSSLFKRTSGTSPTEYRSRRVKHRSTKKK